MAQTWEMPSGVGNTSAWLRGYVQARYPSPVPESAHDAWEHLHHGRSQAPPEGFQGTNRGDRWGQECITAMRRTRRAPWRAR